MCESVRVYILHKRGEGFSRGAESMRNGGYSKFSSLPFNSTVVTTGGDDTLSLPYMSLPSRWTNGAARDVAL